MRRLDKFSIETDQRTPDRACDAPGCTSEGLHRAPRSRETLNQFFWFCLDHVREYNRTWNYCAGMNEHQIERAVREDTVALVTAMVDRKDTGVPVGTVLRPATVHRRPALGVSLMSTPSESGSEFWKARESANSSARCGDRFGRNP